MYAKLCLRAQIRRLRKEHMAISMKEKEIMDKLRSELVIPDVVQERAELALDRIKKEQKKKGKVMKMRTKGKRKSMWLLIAAAVFVFGTMTVCAAYLRWSQGIEAQFQATDEQKQMLEEEQYTAPLQNKGGDEMGNNSVTEAGVTITPLQSIVDSRFAWLSFRVEGYQLEEGKEPCFNHVTVVADDNSDAPISYTASFYNGIHRNEEGKPVYEDGSPADGEIFINEDGSMEYMIIINATEYGGLAGKKLHVEFTDIGTVYKAEFTPDLEGVWSFDFVLKGSDKVRTLTLSDPLGDTGATVIYAEISPISLYVRYDFPMRETTIEGVNENGEPITSSDFVEAPPVTGVRLKDGTFLGYITEGGSMGYLDENREVYTCSFTLDRILDTDQVDALLFLKALPEEARAMTEEDVYVVPVE